MHGYVVPSRIGTFARTTLQLEFSVYSGKKNHVKNKYVKNLELINKVKKNTVAKWLTLYVSNVRDPGSILGACDPIFLPRIKIKE